MKPCHKQTNLCFFNFICSAVALYLFFGGGWLGLHLRIKPKWLVNKEQVWKVPSGGKRLKKFLYDNEADFLVVCILRRLVGIGVK